MLLAWILLTLSRHSSLSPIAYGRFSRLHPLSVQSCCRYFIAGRSTPFMGFTGDVYDVVLTSPAVSRISCLSDLDSFRDWSYVAVQQLFC